MVNIVILISGRGSNLAALLDAARSGELPVRVAGVLSNRAGARGLAIAQEYGVPVEVVEHRRFARRDDFDAALAAAIDRFAPDFLVLAGFMRVLGDHFVHRYHGRLINIHPSLLPAFPGLHTHRRALAEGVRIHGCTVHFVTSELDHGPVIVQAAVPVLDSDDEETLAARVLVQEHRIYPRAIRWLAEGRLLLRDGRVRLTDPQDAAGVLIAPQAAACPLR